MKSARYRYQRPWLLIILGMLPLLDMAFGQVTNLTPVEETWLDRYHDLWCRRVVAGAENLDRFFADKEYEEEAGPNWMKVVTSMHFREYEDPDYKFRIKARLSLPNLEQRALLFVESFRDDEDNPDRPILSEDQETDEKSSLFAGVRFVQEEPLTWRFSVSGGMRFRPEPDPFVRLRLRRDYYHECYRYRLTQYATWRNEIGFGESTRLEVDRAVNTNNLVRFTTEATWSEETEGVNLRQGLQWFTSLSERQALAFEGFMSSHTHPRSIADEYLVRARFKHQMKRYDWMYLVVQPEMRFENDRNWTLAPGITFRLEMLLGEYEHAL